MKRVLLSVLLLSCLFVFNGCPDHPIYPPDIWDIGEFSIYTPLNEPGHEVYDSVTGGTFMFPEGATNEAGTAIIRSGPSAPLEGQSYWISYGGDEPVYFRLPREDSEFVYLLGYGSSNGSFDDSIPADERWHCLPIIEEDDDYITFHLIMPFEVALHRTQRSTHRGFRHHHISRIPAGSSRADTIRASHAQARDFINTILDSLPTSIQAAARAEVTGRLAPRFYSSGNYYKGFFYLTSLFPRPRPMIGIFPFTSGGFIQDPISHEVGHYMNHVLVGDAVYVQLEAQAPPAEHGIGYLNENRSVIVEDIAFFAEYFLTGTVGADVDPTSQLSVLSQTHSRPDPYSYDMPSIEGFGCFLLASLHRTSQTIPNLTTAGRVDSIPVVGASFRDIWGIIAQGATNINQLRGHVEEYLRGVGKEDMLPVIAQRLGWRYRGYGRVVTEDGSGGEAPVQNATIVQIALVNGREYRNSTSLRTGTDGTFSISDLFPGNTILRIFTSETDSTDYPIFIDWNQPTTERQELGDFYVTDSGALINALRSATNIEINFQATMKQSNGGTVHGLQFDCRSLSPVSSTGTSLTQSASGVRAYNIYTDINFSTSISLTISPDGQTILSLETEDSRSFASDSHMYPGTRSYSLSMRTIPLHSFNRSSGNVIYNLRDVETAFVSCDFLVTGSLGDYSFDHIDWSEYSHIQVRIDFSN